MKHNFEKLPSGWSLEKLQAVVNFLDGQRKPVKEEDRRNMQGPYRYYGASGVIDHVNDYLFDDDLILLAEDGANILDRSTPIAFKVSGKIWVNNHAHVLKPKKNVDIDYVVNFLESLSYKKFNSGGAQPKLNLKICQNIPIPVPPPQEQKKIAVILKTWDEAIEKTQNSIVVKERKFAWMVKKLLHPKHHDNENVTEFQSVFEPFKEANRNNADIEVLSVTKDGIISQSEYFNKEIASEDRSKYLVVRRNMLVMSGLNFWMGAIDFQTMCDEGIVSPAYKTFRIINKDFDFDYLRFFIRSPYMTKILIDSSIQGASIVRRNMDTELLMNAVIPAPSLTQQKVIAEILNSAKREIGAHKALLTQYKNQKRGLMQKLLTGEWRVKVDGKSVEAA